VIRRPCPAARQASPTLKTELVHRVGFLTRAAAKSALFELIQVFYNRKRRHSSLGYVS
jgi:transposase InsO family protein